MNLKTLAWLIPLFLTSCQAAFAGEIQPIAFASYAAKDDLYRSGQKAIDEGRWNEAVSIFGKVAEQGGSEADAGLYWKAYAQHRAGRGNDALATIRQLGSSFPKSAWLDDARALEVEIRGDQGRPVQPGAEDDEELKLYALGGMMDNNPQRAFPLVQRYLSAAHSPANKEKALFLLTQCELPQARQALAEVARGSAHAELRLKAIEYMGIAADEDPAALKQLDELYASAQDGKVRHAVLNAFMIAEHKAGLAAAARSEKDPALRREAIELLGAAEGVAELRALLQSESDPQIRMAIVTGLMIAEDDETLAGLARTEKDPRVRMEAIQHLGNVDSRRAQEALRSLYNPGDDRRVRETVIQSLANQENVKALIEIFRLEKDRELRNQIVHRLADMDSPEAEAFVDKLFDQN